MRRADRIILQAAAGQLGLVTRAQLRDAGVDRHAIDGRVRSGWLHPVQRGVYRVGPVAPPHATVMAAVLACGASAVVSHATAACLWGLLDGRPPPALVDVMLPGPHRRRRPGVRVHCTHDLAARDVSALDSIPLTAPARTVVDLAGALAGRALEQVVARAEREGLATRTDLRSVLRRLPRRRGAPALRALLDGADGPDLTRSEAEERFLAMIRRARLPAPETNVRIRGHEVDFFWRVERVVVEVDGFAFHASRRHFEADRRRDAELAATGVRVLRVTWRHLVDDAEATLVRVAQTLVAAVASAHPSMEAPRHLGDRPTRPPRG